MTDPLSITVGILAIAGACSTGVKTLRSAYIGSVELVRLADELHRLEDVLNAVEALSIEKHLVDDVMAGILMTKTTTQARLTAQSLHDFLHKYSESDMHSPKKPRRTLSLKDRKRLSTIAEDIKVARTGIADCLAIANMLYTLRLPAQFAAIERVIETGRLQIPQTVQDKSSNVTRTFVRTDQRHLVSTNSSTQQDHEQAICDLNMIQSQLPQALSLLTIDQAQYQDPSSKSPGHQSEKSDEENLDHKSVTRTFVDVASDTKDDFYDCSSQFHEDSGPHSPNQVSSRPSGSPVYYFESSSTFYGEQSTTCSVVGEIATAVAMVELPCTKTHYIQRYSIIYAESARLWRRVTVSAMIPRASHLRALVTPAAREDSYAFEILPCYLYTQLPTILRRAKMFDTVTDISLSIDKATDSCYTINAAEAVVSEDLEETQNCNEAKMLREIVHMGCRQYLESEVVVMRLIKSSTSLVQLNGQTYVERKIPLSRAALPGENAVEIFYQCLKVSYSLRDYGGVSAFQAVVVDDTRTHLRSYLEESPALGLLRPIFANAQLEGHRIPWGIRESWAKQIIQAVSDIHSRGLVVGFLDFCKISVRIDGNVVLNLRGNGHPYRHTILSEGDMEPGSSRRPVGPYTSQRRGKDFSTDIYDLGLTLWMIAEHRGNINGYLCVRNACTSLPRHMCQAKHANPIELPPCSDVDLPLFFNEVIGQCRQRDPEQRPPARDLLRYFQKTTMSPELANLKSRYLDIPNHTCCCDECGNFVGFEAYYHCNICHLADFDLCQNCVSQGIHCGNKDHRLIKKIFKDGIHVTLY